MSKDSNNTSSNEAEFQQAVKEFDSKNYEKVKKLCEKLVSKNPKDDRALALRGLNFYYLGESEKAEKSLKDALKANIRSGVAWHFYAIFYKEKGNYSKAMQSYTQALRNAPNNINIIRDLSYMHLYLRQLNSFVEKCRLGLETKPGLFINWVSFAFACTLVKDYKSALIALNTFQEREIYSLGRAEKHELRIFYAMILNKAGKYKECVDYLIKNENEFIDKPLVYEMIIKNSFLSKDYETGINYCILNLKKNYDNIDTFIMYFNMKVNQKDFNFKCYDDFLSIGENFKYQQKLLEILSEIKKLFPKSKILSKFELAFNQGEQFKEIFDKYFTTQLEKTIPSFFINVKFIYQLQGYKIKIIQEVLEKYLQQIETENHLKFPLDTPLQKSWVFFYSGEHFLFQGDLEKSISYINRAIDLTPSVVEFYMTLARVFKHSYMLNESEEAFNKSRLLDVGDRYLNAKMSKIYCQNEKVEKSVETMKEFVGDTLSEESINSYQNLCYINECGNSYLFANKILHSHYLFHYMIKIFVDILHDQVDFYNFCLRRNMLRDLYQTIIYFDNLSKNKYVHLALSKLNLIYSYLTYYQLQSQNNDTEYKKLEDNLKKELEELKKENIQSPSVENNFNPNTNVELKYQFTTIKDLLKNIEEDFYIMLTKLQKISEDYEIHYLCVKFFLIKNKTLMALKSLKFLVDKIKININNKSKNYFLPLSIDLMKKFVEKNEKNINENILNKIKEIISIYEKNEKEKEKENDALKFKENENSDENKVILMKFKLYEKGKFCKDEENLKIISDTIDSLDKNTMRRWSCNKVYDLVIFSGLFLDQEEKKIIRNKIKNKMKLTGADDENILKEFKRNINFYEDKKFN